MIVRAFRITSPKVSIFTGWNPVGMILEKTKFSISKQLLNP